MQAITTTGARGYLQWLKANQPRLYAGILPKLTQGLSGLGADTMPYDPTNPDAMFMAQPAPSDPISSASSAPATASWTDTVSKLVQSAASIFLTKNQLDAQKQINTIQLQRAQAGLPPLNIDPSKYGLTPTMNVGISGGTQQLLMYGGIGLAVVFLLSSFMGKRR